MNLEYIVMSLQRLKRLAIHGNTTCAKCGKELKVGDEAVKKKMRRGKNNYYHKEPCFDRIFC